MTEEVLKQKLLELTRWGNPDSINELVKIVHKYAIDQTIQEVARLIKEEKIKPRTN